MMVNFKDAIFALERMGLADVILPFILIFTIIFAILQKVQPFGANVNKPNRIYLIIALSIALLVIIPHVTGDYPPGGDVVDIINTSLPGVAVVLVAIVMGLILIGSLGADIKFGTDNKTFFNIIAVLSLLVIVYIFGSAAGWFNYWYLEDILYWIDPGTQAIIFIILLSALVFWFINSGSDTPPRTP